MVTHCKRSWLGIYFGPLVCYVFLINPLLFTKQCEICNFVDDSTTDSLGKEFLWILNMVKHNNGCLTLVGQCPM